MRNFILLSVTVSAALWMRECTGFGGIADALSVYDSQHQRQWTVFSDDARLDTFYYLPASYGVSRDGEGEPLIYSRKNSEGSLLIDLFVSPHWAAVDLERLQVLLSAKIGRPALLAPVVLSLHKIHADLELERVYGAKMVWHGATNTPIDPESQLHVSLEIPSKSVADFNHSIFPRVVGLGGFSFPMEMDIETIIDDEVVKMPYSTSFLFGSIDVCHIHPDVVCGS